MSDQHHAAAGASPTGDAPAARVPHTPAPASAGSGPAPAAAADRAASGPRAGAPDALVELRGVSKSYRRADTGETVTAVEDVTLDVRRGEVLGVIGYSGAGKSTLVRLVNALELPTSGTVTVDGQELTAIPERDRRLARRRIGMIFQQFNLFRSRTIAGNVAYPLKVAGVAKAERDRKVAELLDFVGLLDRAHAHPEQLSGGQKQRVGIARALAGDPQLLLADEATSALDPETTAEVLGLLRRVNRELGVTIVVITHEMDAVRRIADRVAVMERGSVVEVGDVYDVFSAPRTEPARRFVRTALHDRPSAEQLDRLRRHHTGRLVTVQVTDRSGLQATVDEAFRHAGVAAELVFGGVGEIRERRIGSLTYDLSGAPGTVDRAVAALRADGITVTEETGGTATEKTGGTATEKTGGTATDQTGGTATDQTGGAATDRTGGTATGGAPTGAADDQREDRA